MKFASLYSLAGDTKVKNPDDLSADTMAKWVAVCALEADTRFGRTTYKHT